MTPSGNITCIFIAKQNYKNNPIVTSVIMKKGKYLSGGMILHSFVLP